MMTLKVTRNYSAEIPDGVFIFDGEEGKCPDEDSDLISFVSWIKRHYPAQAGLMYHIPNESMKPVQGRMMDKKKGVKDGAPDICFATVPALYIEFKRRDKKLSLGSKKHREHFENQLRVLAAFAAAGNVCAVVFGLDAAKKAFKAHFKVD